MRSLMVSEYRHPAASLTETLAQWTVNTHYYSTQVRSSYKSTKFIYQVDKNNRYSNEDGAVNAVI